VWCGIELAAGQLFVFTPGTTFAANEPSGLAATLLCVPVDSLATAGLELGVGELLLRRCVEPVPDRPVTERLVAGLWAATARPDLVERGPVSAALLRSAAGALADIAGRPAVATRRLERSRIVSVGLFGVRRVAGVVAAIDERVVPSRERVGEQCPSGVRGGVRHGADTVFSVSAAQHAPYRVAAGGCSRVDRHADRQLTRGDASRSHLGAVSSRVRRGAESDAAVHRLTVPVVAPGLPARACLVANLDSPIRALVV